MRWKTLEYSGWGRSHRARGDLARPERRADLARICAETPAPAIGMRRSYGDAATNDAGRAIDMTRLDRMTGFDPDAGLLEVEAGTRLGEIAAALAPRGWLPAVLPGTGFATVGGAIAQDVHGKNHHHAGSFGQHVECLTLLQGGATVEVAPGTDLFLATLGGLGQTGVIVSARLRLMRVPGAAMEVRETRAAHWSDHLAALERSDAPYCVGWIDATATGATLGRGIVEEARHSAGPVAAQTRARKVALDAPGLALSAPVVRAFNAAYFNRIPPAGRTRLRALPDFFFPLDRLHDWNRLYGKRGFHQFQCVVPPGAAKALREMLEAVAASGLASPLAVLKRMGPGRAGMLSFPMAGWTLAIDFPNGPAARDLIARLEAMALAAEGRIYLAKDALAAPATIRAMYPELGAWAHEAARADPQGYLATDLVRRLQLRAPA